MRILDAYCGVGPLRQKDPLVPWTPEEILAILDQCGIERALVYSNLVHSMATVADANARATALAAGCRRFVPAFCLSPHPYAGAPGPEDYARAMAQAGARAAWLWGGHGFSTWLVGGLLEMCAERRIPLFVPADAITPDQIHTLCSEFPRLRLVLANLSYTVDPWLYPLLRRHPELRVCLGPAYIPPLAPERFARHFGVDRLIFGSGLPHIGPGGLIGMVMYARLPDADKEKILSGNLDTLMREVRL